MLNSLPSCGKDLRFFLQLKDFLNFSLETERKQSRAAERTFFDSSSLLLLKQPSPFSFVPLEFGPFTPPTPKMPPSLFLSKIERGMNEAERVGLSTEEKLAK